MMRTFPSLNEGGQSRVNRKKLKRGADPNALHQEEVSRKNTGGGFYMG